jgi:hypothetical protein
MARRRVLPTLAVFAAAAFCLPGCTAYRQSRSPLEQVLSENPGVHLRVTVEGRKTPIGISSCRIEGDSLYGRGRYLGHPDPEPSPSDWDWPYRKWYRTTSVVIPLSAIRTVEAREFSAGKTVALVAAIGVTAAAVAALVAVSTAGGPLDNVGSDSCPLIYCWDGSEWWLDSGTYAGAIMPALARTDVDILEHATALDGTLRLRLTGRGGETEHVDALAIQAVDHPRGTFIAPDGKGRLHVLTNAAPPLAARDFRGGDALRRIADRDGWGWESSPSGRDPERDVDVRDGLEIEFTRPGTARVAFLTVDASNTLWAAYLMQRFVGLQGSRARQWYEAVAANPADRAALVAGFAREAFLSVSVWDGAGWVKQGFIPEAGPELPRRQALAIDLTRASDERVRIRLESAPSLWNIDRVRLAVDAGREPIVRDLPMLSARDENGRRVGSLLESAGDDREYVIEPGAAAALRFESAEAPGEDIVRTYVARTTGWYEIHAAGIGQPDPVLAARLVREPLSASRFFVREMNTALDALDRMARAEAGLTR